MLFLFLKNVKNPAEEFQKDSFGNAALSLMRYFTESDKFRTTLQSVSKRVIRKINLVTLIMKFFLDCH